MSKQSIKATIDANIKQNGVQDITGQIMNSVLNQMVDNLAEEASTTEKLTELEGAKHIVTERGKNLFSGENVDGYLKNSSGEIGVVGDWKTSDFIDISNIAKVVFSGGAAEDSTARMAAFWLLAYDADKIPIASSYNGGTGVFYFDNLYGASYLRISYHGTNINYVQVESGNSVTSYEPYRIVTTLLQSNYIRKEEVNVLENIKQIVGKNLIDSSKSVTGYIKNNSGTIDIAGDWMTTDFIDVSTLSDIVFTSVQSDQIRHINDMYFFLGYDNDKSPIASTYATTIHTPYSIPDGVSYIRFAYHRNIESDLQLEAGRVPTSYEPYKVVTLLESSDYQRMGSLWRGKKWCVVGDSLTEKNIRATKHYYDYVQEVTGISVENKGASGSGYARTDNKFYTRISSISADVDVITIFGSGNDAGADLPIGEPEDTALTSLCGYINKCIDEVQRLFPLVPFGIVTPTPWNGGEPNDPTSAWFTNYSKAIVDICALRGVPCLDLYHCSNLHPSNEEFRRLAYSRDADGVDGNPNGTHPDENGHKIIAPRFKAFLETLLI